MVLKNDSGKDTKSELPPEEDGPQDDFDASFDEFAGEENDNSFSDHEDDGNEEESEAHPNSGNEADQGEQDTPDNTQQPQPEPEPKQEQDLTAGMTEDQKAAYNAAIHEVSTNRGRLSAQAKQLNALQSELAAYKQAAEKKKETKEQGDGDPFASIREDYPELADSISGIISNLSNQVQSLNGELAAVKGHTEQDVYDKNADALNDMHSDYLSIVGTETTGSAPEWRDWVQKQPQFVIDILRENGENIVNPQNAAYVIQMFKDQTGYHAAKPNTELNTQTEQGGAAPSQRMSGRRELQKRAMDTVTSKRSNGSPKGFPDEFDAAFDRYADQD